MRTFRHVFWTDYQGNPCIGHEVQSYRKDGSVIPPSEGHVTVKWETLPARCIMPKRQCMPLTALVEV